MTTDIVTRFNFTSGTVENDPLASGGTSLTSVGLPAIAGSGEYARVVLDPRGVHGAPEIVHARNRTSSGGTYLADLARGMEGTSARAHPFGTEWAIAPALADVPASWNRALQQRPAGSGDLTINWTSYDYFDGEADLSGGRINVEEGDVVRIELTFQLKMTGTNQLFVDFEVTTFAAHSGGGSTVNLNAAYGSTARFKGAIEAPVSVVGFYRVPSGVRQLYVEPVAKVDTGSATVECSATRNGPLMVVHRLGPALQVTEP